MAALEAATQSPRVRAAMKTISLLRRRHAALVGRVEPGHGEWSYPTPVSNLSKLRVEIIARAVG